PERLGLREAAAGHRGQRPVAYARHARRRLVMAGSEEAPHLLHHPTGQHATRAFLEAAVVRPSLALEPEHEQVPWRYSPRPASARRGPLLVLLDCPDDPAPVVGVKPGRPRWIA